MKSFWLKIIGLLLSVVVVMIGVYICWAAESTDTQQVLKEDKRVRSDAEQAQAEHRLGLAELKSPEIAGPKKVDPRAENSRQMVNLLSTIYRNPGSSQAKKARGLLLKVPKGLEEQYNATKGKRNFQFLNRPEAKRQKH